MSPSVLVVAHHSPRSLSPACTPIKQRYDACFNAWFEGYLQPALDTANRARQSVPGPRSPGAPQVDNVADPTVPKRIITNWSSAFRRRDYSKAAVPPDTTTDEAPTFQHVPSQLPPIDPRGKTRAQIKAEEYDRNCGSAWREYNACLKASQTPPRHLGADLTDCDCRKSELVSTARVCTG